MQVLEIFLSCMLGSPVPTVHMEDHPCREKPPTWPAMKATSHSWMRLHSIIHMQLPLHNAKASPSLSPQSFKRLLYAYVCPWVVFCMCFTLIFVPLFECLFKLFGHTCIHTWLALDTPIHTKQAYLYITDISTIYTAHPGCTLGCSHASKDL